MTRNQRILIRNLHKIMSDFDLYQYELADMLGVNRSVLNETLNGKNIPTLNFIYAVMDKFRTINMNWLLKGEGEQWQGAPPRIIKGAPKTAPRVAQIKT